MCPGVLESVGQRHRVSAAARSISVTRSAIGSMSSEMSAACTECVKAPTDTKSAPVVASSGNPFQRDAAARLGLRAPGEQAHRLPKL